MPERAAGLDAALPVRASLNGQPYAKSFMNIRLTATAALLASVLSACAITSAPAPVAQAPVPAPEAAYPKLALSNDILFGVLASEIAAQRGAAAASAPTVLALAQRTRDPRLARRAAEFALTANRLDEAIRALKLWQELEPASDNAQYQLIAALLRAGRLSEATPGVQAQLAARPQEAPQVFMHLAGLLSRQPDKAGAYAMMKTLLAPYPSVAEGHFALMITAQEAGDDAMAQAEMATLATLAPAWDYPVGWQVERLRQTSPEAALSLLERELARRPQAGLELRLSYPRLLVMVKRYDAARDAFVQLSNKYPHQPEVAYAIGVLSYELKDYEEAERSLRDALALGYREPDFVRFTLGQMAEERKLPQEAVNWYEAITSGPQLPQAQSRLAVLEAEDGKLDAALARLERLADMQSTPRPARACSMRAAVWATA